MALGDGLLYCAVAVQGLSSWALEALSGHLSEGITDAHRMRQHMGLGLLDASGVTQTRQPRADVVAELTSVSGGIPDDAYTSE